MEKSEVKSEVKRNYVMALKMALKVAPKMALKVAPKIPKKKTLTSGQTLYLLKSKIREFTHHEQTPHGV